VTVFTWGSQTVDGDWKTGYNINLKGGKIVQLDVDRTTNTVANVKIIPRPDEVVLLTFTENQKRAIEISLTDPKIKEFVQNNKFYVSLARDYGNVQFGDKDCGFNDCALVQITSLTGKASAGTIVNTKTGEIHFVQVRTG
jgi:hypothetical protein